MPYHSSVLLSWTQLWRACGVGASTHFVLEFKWRTPIGALPIECRERNASACFQRTFHFVAKIRKIAGRSFIFPCLWTTLVQWCVEERFCAAELVITAVQDQKANATLTALNLRGNHVGDAGATALADALQATVSACGHTAFQECASCCHRCCFARWSEQLASPSCCAVCVALFFFLCLEGKRRVAWSIVRELF